MGPPSVTHAAMETYSKNKHVKIQNREKLDTEPLVYMATAGIQTEFCPCKQTFRVESPKL